MLAVAAIVTAGGLVTAVADPSLARPDGLVTAPTASSHALAYLTGKVVVRRFGPDGQLVSRQVHHLGGLHGSTLGPIPEATLPPQDTAGVNESGTDRAGPESGGTAREDYSITGHSTLGKTLWTFDSWSKWSWDHRQCPCTMNEIDHGVIGTSDDSAWSYDGTVDSGTGNGYLGGGGGPHTAYQHDAEGQFTGPSVLPRNGRKRLLDVHRRPSILEQDNNDGTIDWWKLCC